MRNAFSAFSMAILLCFALSCQNKAEKAEFEKMRATARTEEQNKNIMRQMHLALDSQNVDRLVGLFAPGAVIHGAEPQEDITAENATLFLEPFYRAFPDLNHRIEDIIAEGDKVVARVLIQATHKGELQGIHQTGNKVKYYQITILQIVDGKIKEGWRITDSLGCMSQLGMELRPKPPTMAR
jgi:predicted ester cyclase